MTAGSLSARARYTAFIARHDVAWELAFAALAIVYVLVGFAGNEAGGTEFEVLLVVDMALTVLFVLEFSTRLLAAPDPIAHLRGHWVDLVALVPTVRGLRVLRLLRLLRLVRAFAGIYRAINDLGRLANHRGLARLIVAWLAVMVICSIGMYVAENGVNKAIESPLDALWWGVVTLTTVGYGDVVPITGEGRIFAAALMILGIGLFGAITATMASYLVATQEEAEDPEPIRLLRDLVRLRDAGVLTADEFGAKSADVVQRL